MRASRLRPPRLPARPAFRRPVLQPTAGDLNVVVISWSDATSAVNTVADSLGNPYSLAIGPTTGTGQQSIYYAKNIKTGSNSVTVTFNQSASSPDLRILEYSGVDTTSPLDGSLGANGTSAFADTGFTAFANANDLIIGADITGAKNIVPGSPFTNRALTTSTGSHIVEDRITKRNWQLSRVGAALEQRALVSAGGGIQGRWLGYGNWSGGRRSGSERGHCGRWYSCDHHRS